MVYRQRIFGLVTNQAREPQSQSVPLVPGDPQPRGRRARPAAAGRLGAAVRARARTGRSCSAEGSVADRAVGEDVEIEFDEAAGVRTLVRAGPRNAARAGISADRDQRSAPAGPLRGRVSPRPRDDFSAEPPARPPRRHAFLVDDHPGQRPRRPCATAFERPMTIVDAQSRADAVAVDVVSPAGMLAAESVGITFAR